MNGSYIIRALPGLVKILAGMKIPLRVTHCVTYRCNLDCSYCSRHGTGGTEMSTKEIMAVMESFRSAGCRFWSFNGGEPLIRDDIGDLINHGKNIGLYISFATNGTLVADRTGDIDGTDMVSISLDGPGEIQDRYRSSSFARVMKGASALKNRGVPFTFTTVVGTHNLDALGDILDIAERYGTVVFFQPIRVQKEDVREKSLDLFPSRERMADGMRFLLRAREAGRPVASSPGYLEAILSSWPDRMPEVRCRAGRTFCFITPDGYATACCDTLAGTGKITKLDTRVLGAGAFRNIPRFACRGCYSSIVLETNLFFDTLGRRPWKLPKNRARV